MLTSCEKTPGFPFTHPTHEMFVFVSGTVIQVTEEVEGDSGARGPDDDSSV